MALNSSGPISLGGTTAGVSIEVELGGGGTTQISLNDANVRSLAGVSSGAIVMPTNFYGKSSAYYLIAFVEYQVDNSVAAGLTGVAIGPNGLWLSSAQSKPSGTPSGPYLVITPISSSGTFGSAFGTTPATPQGFTEAGYGSSGYGLNYNSSNGLLYNVLAVADNGSASPSFRGQNIEYLTTWNTSGSLQSHRLNQTNQSGYYYNNDYNMWSFVDSSGNFYLICNTQIRNSGCYCPYYYIVNISKFSSTLGFTSSIALGNPGISVYVMSAANLGNDGNLYVGLNASGVIVRLNTSLSITSSTYFTSSGLQNSPVSAVNADSSGNIIALYGLGQVLLSFNPSTLAINWIKNTNVGINTGGVCTASIAIDSSNNVYLLQYLTSNYQPYITKFNSSGTQQWQRRLNMSTISSSYPYPVSLQISGTQMFIGLGINSINYGSYMSYVAVLPTDGSKTGTYTLTSSVNITITYSDTSISGSPITWSTPGGTYTITSQSVYTLSTSTFSSSVSLGTSSPTALYSSVISI